MGAWGAGLYANDSTCDVRDTYIGFLEDQLSNQEAYEKTLEKCREYIGDQDEPFLWFALAESQWKVGRLMPEVKSKALDWIRKGGGLELWEDGRNNGSGWKKTLEKLRIKLETEQPKEKRIRKPEIINQNLWNVNDVYAYQFHTEEANKYGIYGKYMLIQKIGEGTAYSEAVKMRIHVFDKLFEVVPSIEETNGIRILPFDFPTTTRILCTNALMVIWKKKNEYPAEYLTYIGSRPAPQNAVLTEFERKELSWQGIEGWGSFFPLWRGVEYETIEEGVFKYTHPE